MRRLGPVLLCALLAVAGCGPPDDETVRPAATTTLPPAQPRDLVDLPVGTGAVHPGDRVRAAGSALRVNGRLVPLAPLHVDGLAVVEGGVYFRNGTELWFTDLRHARATGYADVESLVASPDGRTVAFLDLQHGPKDGHGTPLAFVVAYDATTGKPLVASYAGMGDVRTDDLSRLYQQAQPAVTGLVGRDVLVHGATADYRIPIDGGTPEKVATP